MNAPRPSPFSACRRSGVAPPAVTASSAAFFRSAASPVTGAHLQHERACVVEEDRAAALPAAWRRDDRTGVDATQARQASDAVGCQPDAGRDRRTVGGVLDAAVVAVGAAPFEPPHPLSATAANASTGHAPRLHLAAPLPPPPRRLIMGRNPDSAQPQHHSSEIL